VATRKKKNLSALFDRRSLPSVPAFAPGWDAFYLAIFAQFKQCSAPHGTLECACRWSSGRQGKPSKLEHGISDIQHDPAFSDTLLIVLLMIAPFRASGTPKMFVRQQIEATASIPKITSSLDANTAQKLLETIVRPQ
jgi:hypothetical protein